MVKNLPAMWETQFQSLGRKDPRRREGQPVLVFLPGEFHGQRSLAVYSPWSCKELNTTEQLTHTHILTHTEAATQSSSWPTAASVQKEGPAQCMSVC